MKKLETVTAEYMTVCKLLMEKESEQKSLQIPRINLQRKIEDLRISQEYLEDEMNKYSTEVFKR